MLFEVCAQSYTSALTAQKGGADRIELCGALPLGGITPSYGAMKLTRDYLQIPICVLVRPRSGDFLYSESEMEEILRDIEFCKMIGMDGIVVGAQLQDGQLNIPFMKQMKSLAGGMDLVCHRVFDQTPDPFKAMEELIEMGYDRILTSGQEPTAFEGKDLIAQLIEKSNNRITIMPGSGITEHNAKELVDISKATEIHFTAQRKFASRVEVNTNVDFSIHTDSNASHYETDLETIRLIKSKFA